MRIKKLAVIIIAAAAITALIGGCGAGGSTSDNSTDNSSQNSQTQQSTQIDMNDIELSTGTCLIDGVRRASFSFTNNSSFTIIDYEIAFTQADDVTDEQKAAFIAELQSMMDLDEEELEFVNSNPIGMHGYAHETIAPGETMSGAALHYYSSGRYVNEESHVSLVKPDIIEITYTDGEYVYEGSYDCIGETYYPEETRAAREWGHSALAEMVPQPDEMIIEVEWDSDTSFSFEMHAISASSFDNYLSSVIEAGFTENATSRTGSYNAQNAEGYEIDLYQFDTFNYIQVSIDAPQ